MANPKISSLTATWNDAGTTFTGIGIDVTDTASASGSKLLDLKVGGSSRHSVDKDGNVGLGINSTVYIGVLAGGRPKLHFTSSNTIASDGMLGATDFLGLGSNTTSFDVKLYRDAANTLAQRNGANAQEQRWWNTFTDASNGEYGYASWKETANVFEIGTKALGTGTDRNLSLISGGSKLELGSGGNANWEISFTHLLPSVTNSRDLGAPANAIKNFYQAGFHEMVEMTAPSAGGATAARIFAEDDGAGKTRLMVIFGTGAAQQIAIEP